MTRRVSFDLRTASLGWAVFELCDTQNAPSPRHLLGSGARIFSPNVALAGNTDETTIGRTEVVGRP